MLNLDVLTRGMIRYVFKWEDGDNSTIMSQRRTTIIPNPSIPSPLPYSTLTLSPLSTADINFTCTAMVIETNSALQDSEPAMSSILVNVTGESV